MLAENKHTGNTMNLTSSETKQLKKTKTDKISWPHLEFKNVKKV